MGDNIPKKKLLMVTVVLIIVGIIFIVASLFGATNENEGSASGINPYTNEVYLTEKEVQQKIENSDIYANLDIVVNNLYDFVKVYKGDLETKDYTDYIRDLNENFANLYLEVKNASNMEKYFEDNKDTITEKYGIVEYDEFEKLVEYIQVYKTSGLTYKDVTLVKDSVTVEKEYTSTKVNITYSNDVQKVINIDVINDSTLEKPEFVINF